MDQGAWQNLMTSWPIIEYQKENRHSEFFHFSGLIQIYQLIFGNKKIRHIIATKSSITYCWVFGQWLNTLPAPWSASPSEYDPWKRVFFFKSIELAHIFRYHFVSGQIFASLARLFFWDFFSQFLPRPWKYGRQLPVVCIDFRTQFPDFFKLSRCRILFTLKHLLDEILVMFLTKCFFLFLLTSIIFPNRDRFIDVVIPRYISNCIISLLCG